MRGDRAAAARGLRARSAGRAAGRSRSAKALAASLRKPDAKIDRLNDVDHLHSVVLYLQESKRELEEQLGIEKERAETALQRAEEAEKHKESFEDILGSHQQREIALKKEIKESREVHEQAMHELHRQLGGLQEERDELVGRLGSASDSQSKHVEVASKLEQERAALLQYAADLEEQIAKEKEKDTTARKQQGALRILHVLRRQHEATARQALRQWSKRALVQHPRYPSPEDKATLEKLQNDLETSQINQLASSKRVQVLEQRLEALRGELTDTKLKTATAEAAARTARQRMSEAVAESNRLKQSQSSARRLAQSLSPRAAAAARAHRIDGGSASRGFGDEESAQLPALARRSLAADGSSDGFGRMSPSSRSLSATLAGPSPRSAFRRDSGWAGPHRSDHTPSEDRAHAVRATDPVSMQPLEGGGSAAAVPGPARVPVGLRISTGEVHEVGAMSGGGMAAAAPSSPQAAAAGELEAVAVSLAGSLRGEQARSTAARTALQEARSAMRDASAEAARWRDAHDRKEAALARSEASFEKASDAQTSLLRVLAVLRDSLPQGRAEIDSAIQSAAVAAQDLEEAGGGEDAGAGEAGPGGREGPKTGLQLLEDLARGSARVQTVRSTHGARMAAELRHRLAESREDLAAARAAEDEAVAARKHVQQALDGAMARAEEADTRAREAEGEAEELRRRGRALEEELQARHAALTALEERALEADRTVLSMHEGARARARAEAEAEARADGLEAELHAEREMRRTQGTAAGGSSRAASAAELRRLEQAAAVSGARVRELQETVRSLEARLREAESEGRQARSRLAAMRSDLEEEQQRAGERLDTARRDLQEAGRRAEEAEARAKGARHSLEVEQRARAAAEQGLGAAVASEKERLDREAAAVLDASTARLEEAQGAAEAARAEAEEAKAALEEARGAARARAEGLEAELEAARAELEQQSQATASAAEAQGAAETRAEQLQEQVREAEGKAETAEGRGAALQKELDGARGEARALQAQADLAAEQAKQAAEEAERLRARVGALEAELEEAKAAAGTADATMDRLRQRAQEAEEEAAGLRDRKADLEEELQEAREDVTATRSVCDDAVSEQRRLQQEAESARRSLAELQAAASEQEEQGREEARRRDASARQEVAGLQEALDEARAALSEAKAARGAADDRVGRLEREAAARAEQLQQARRGRERESEETARGVVAVARAQAAREEAEARMEAAEAALVERQAARSEALQRLRRAGAVGVVQVASVAAGATGGAERAERLPAGESAAGDGSPPPAQGAAESRAEAAAEEARILAATQQLAEGRSGPATASHAAVVASLAQTIQAGTRDLAEARQSAARLHRTELELRRRVQYLETRQTELQAHLAFAMREVAQLQGKVGGWTAAAGRVAAALLPAAKAAARAARGAAERAVALSSPSSQSGSSPGPRTPSSSGGGGSRDRAADLSGASPRARRMAAHASEVDHCVGQLEQWAEASEEMVAGGLEDAVLAQLRPEEVRGTAGLLLASSQQDARHAKDALELSEATIRAITDELSLARAEVTRLTEDAVGRASQASELQAQLRDAEGEAERERLLAVSLREHAATLRSLVPERVRPHLPPSPQLRPAEASHVDALEEQRGQGEEEEGEGGNGGGEWGAFGTGEDDGAPKFTGLRGSVSSLDSDEGGPGSTGWHGAPTPRVQSAWAGVLAPPRDRQEAVSGETNGPSPAESPASLGSEPSATSTPTRAAPSLPEQEAGSEPGEHSRAAWPVGDESERTPPGSADRSQRVAKSRKRLPSSLVGALQDSPEAASDFEARESHGGGGTEMVQSSSGAGAGDRPLAEDREDGKEDRGEAEGRQERSLREDAARLRRLRAGGVDPADMSPGSIPHHPRKAGARSYPGTPDSDRLASPAATPEGTGTPAIAGERPTMPGSQHASPATQADATSDVGPLGPLEESKASSPQSASSREGPFSRGEEDRQAVAQSPDFRGLLQAAPPSKHGRHLGNGPSGLSPVTEMDGVEEGREARDPSTPPRRHLRVAGEGRRSEGRADYSGDGQRDRDGAGHTKPELSAPPSPVPGAEDDESTVGSARSPELSLGLVPPEAPVSRPKATAESAGTPAGPAARRSTPRSILRTSPSFVSRARIAAGGEQEQPCGEVEVSGSSRSSSSNSIDLGGSSSRLRVKFDPEVVADDEARARSEAELEEALRGSRESEGARREGAVDPSQLSGVGLVDLLRGLDQEAVLQLQEAVRGSAEAGAGGAGGVDMEGLLERVYSSIRGVAPAGGVGARGNGSRGGGARGRGGRRGSGRARGRGVARGR